MLSRRIKLKTSRYDLAFKYREMKETCNAKSIMKRGVSTKTKMTEEEKDEAPNNLHLVLSILMIGSLGRSSSATS